jgi:aspartoacylase
MSINNVALVGGTHGNELTGVYLLKNWDKKEREYDFSLNFFYGNPEAIKQGRRYIEKDLNRCFSDTALEEKSQNLETDRALELKEQIMGGKSPADFIIDLHTTTGPMGPTVILTDDSELSLNCAKYVVKKNPNVKIIREILDSGKNHFLTSLSSAGLIVEVGPIPQGVLRHDIFDQTESLVMDILEYLSLYKNGDILTFDERMYCYEVIDSVDYPRDEDGELSGMVHGNLQEKEFKSLVNGDPLFYLFDGKTLNYEGEEAWPIFINEAAYYEKGIAMVLTKKRMI